MARSCPLPSRFADALAVDVGGVGGVEVGVAGGVGVVIAVPFGSVRWAWLAPGVVFEFGGHFGGGNFNYDSAPCDSQAISDTTTRILATSYCLVTEARLRTSTTRARNPNCAELSREHCWHGRGP